MALDISAANAIFTITVPAGNSIAHVFLSFGFDDGRHLAVSIETRRQKKFGYSTIAGLCQTPVLCGCGFTRPTRCISPCPHCVRGPLFWSGMWILSMWNPSSTRRCLHMLPPAPTSRLLHRSMSHGGRCSLKGMGWSAMPCRLRSKFANRLITTLLFPNISACSTPRR